MTARVPQVPRITSRQHAVVTRCRRLASRRDAETGVLLDGEHLVDEALSAGIPLDLLLTDGRAPALVSRAAHAGAVIYEGSGAVLEAASPARTPSGIVAIARWAPGGIATTLESPTALALGLIDVQDPGNVGAVIRAADALGATGVLALDGTADPAGWKALRGAMGSTFRVAVARGDAAAALAEARARGVRVAATVAGAGTALPTADLRGPLLVLLGNEGAGLPADLVSGADARMTIPMRPGVNSLNVAVTAALVLWEARRQRKSDVE